MASCTGNGSNNSTYQLVLTVTQGTQSVSNNTTVVNWTLQLKSTGAYSFAQWSSTIKAYINGSEVYNNTSQREISAGQTLTIASGNKTISHNSDGTKSINFSASYNEGSTAYYTPRFYKLLK